MNMIFTSFEGFLSAVSKIYDKNALLSNLKEERSISSDLKMEKKTGLLTLFSILSSFLTLLRFPSAEKKQRKRVMLNENRNALQQILKRK